MFKRYGIDYKGHNGSKRHIDFYIQLKKSGKGKFLYRAIAIGDIPRLDHSSEEYDKYQKNSRKLAAASRCSCEVNTSLCEPNWLGQSCLLKLWNKISALSFTDMHQVSSTCPFASSAEPIHEDIIEAEHVFREAR